MVNLNFKFFLKLGLSFILAFFFSKFLVEKVVFPSAPAMRPTLKNQISQISARLLASRNPNLPPSSSTRLPPPRYFTPPTRSPTSVYQYPTQPPIFPTTTPVFGYPTATPPPFSPSATVIPPQPTPTQAASPGTAPSQIARDLLDLINNERGKNGRPLISFENHLNEAAQKHGDDMKKRNYFYHI